MLVFSVLLALTAGWCSGGRLSRYESAGLRILPLPAAALLLQRLCAAPWALLLSYGLIFIFLCFNRHLKKTALLMGAGSLCNLAVIAANGWRMPVAAWAVDHLSAQGAADLAAGRIPIYAPAGPETRLLFLGDVLYCPIPLFRGFASPGDLLLAAGLFFCLMAVMAPERLPKWMRAG
ncbi:MAG: hypothetical protein EOM52_03120 [Clostridia bacterium]|nr:hypothetical protein [Clostridia bacterium]